EEQILRVRRGARAVDVPAWLGVEHGLFAPVLTRHPQLRAPILLGDDPARVQDVAAVGAPIRRAVVALGFAHGVDFVTALRESSNVPIRAQSVRGADERFAVGRPDELLDDALPRQHAHDLTARHVDDLNALGCEAGELPPVRTPGGPAVIAAIDYGVVAVRVG